ncbi:Hsp70 nucleotide exchange factor fes1-like protein [Elsinoe fawcettii]|nr:Hsp70 nucleotide exchange factor fes1-like protein [Elsinoe fawcettii]
MTDPGLNSLLKWGLENSEEGRTGQAAAQPSDAPARGLDAEALKRLMGGPSDADLMKEAMSVIHHPEADLEAKLIAWDNFEQLIENLDNANNMSNLGLWEPLVQKLQDQEAEVRRMAAWCAGTAVQNNIKSQVKLLAVGAIPSIIDLAVNDTDKAVRKKAIMALSSGVRNYQPALDEALKRLPPQFKPADAIEASDMDAIDTIMDKLRQNAARVA